MPFSKQTLDFLFENRLHDSKEWFLEHKKDYEALVYQPLQEFSQIVGPMLTDMDPLLIIEPKTNKAISRIYRDTRFSKDKSVFRQRMWCVFARDKKMFINYPGFYFQVSPDGFDYGCGYYYAEPQTLERYRGLILSGSPVWQKTLSFYENQDEFQLMGDCYKRSKFSQQDEKIRSFLDRKGVCFGRESRDFEWLFSENFAKDIGERLRQLRDPYRFLCVSSGAAIDEI